VRIELRPGVDRRRHQRTGKPEDENGRHQEGESQDEHQAPEHRVTRKRMEPIRELGELRHLTSQNDQEGER